MTTGVAPDPLAPPAAVRGALPVRRRRGDLVLGVLSRGAAVAVVLMLVSLVAVLGYAAAPSVRTFGWSFLVTSEWRPNELERPVKVHDGRVLREEGEGVT